MSGVRQWNGTRNDVATVQAYQAPLPATKYQIAGYDLNTDPGTTYAYSNFGFSLLGDILDRIHRRA